MIASWYGNVFRVAGPLWGKSIGYTSERTSNTELWCYCLIFCQPEHTDEQIAELFVILDTMASTRHICLKCVDDKSQNEEADKVRVGF